MTADHILEVDALAVAYDHTTVFRDVSFVVRKGDSLAVIGPNGSGKTVLFRALLGVIPYRGRITWAPGTRIGYVPQKLDIERDLPLTGRDLLRAREQVAGGDETTAWAMSLLGLGGDVDRPIGHLSGGQFQRLLIALALLGKTNVLLLDEPTAGVDEPSHLHINQQLRRLEEERQVTVLFISHELNVVSRFATDVLCLARRQAWFGPPRSILTTEKLSAAYGMPVQFHVHD